MGQIVHEQGLHTEAETLLRSALAGFESSLGADHPQVLGCARNLAVLLKQVFEKNNGRMDLLSEADALLRRALAGYSKSLGDGHPESTRVARNLANFQAWRAKRER